MDKKKFLAVVIFFVITALTIIMRYMFIGTPFWYDEACSWIAAKQDFPFGIMDYLLNNDLQHTPLYFFLLHFWMKIFGNGEYAIKFLSLIFGIGTVPLVFTAARKLADKKIAVYATCIAAVSPVLAYFSTEARMYPLAVFLVMLSVNFLIDFEKSKNYKSLIKLVIVNVLIPYTLVGGILYNISLAVTYTLYLLKTNKQKLRKYLTTLCAEIFLLIPYFLMLIHYANMRKMFVISHEGAMPFAAVVDVIRNFFALELVPNIYWPSLDPYFMSITFLIFVIIPCVYLCYGIVQGYKNSKGFIKLLYSTFILCFILYIITAKLSIHIFTVRYILYILPPLLILAVIGLSKKITVRHLQIFVVFFVIFGVLGNIKYGAIIPNNKYNAFAAVAQESLELGMNGNDIVIMPFGSDAPYYFKSLSTPRLYEFDFHKELRNPYNDKFYDKNQQNIMASKQKYQLIYDIIAADKEFSRAHNAYFFKNVVDNLDSGRFVLIALYGEDAQALVDLKELKASVTSADDVKNNIVSIMLMKYLFDIRAYLNNNFRLLKMYNKGNYTYLYLQKI